MSDLEAAREAASWKYALDHTPASPFFEDLLDGAFKAGAEWGIAAAVNECPHCGGHLLFAEQTDFACESCGDKWSLVRPGLLPMTRFLPPKAEANDV